MSPLVRNASKWVRTLHIYLSLPGLLLFAFFAATGILLNHDFFGFDQIKTNSRRIKLETGILRDGSKDTIIRQVRSSFAIRLPVTSFSAGSGDIDIAFSAPGQRVHVLIDRETSMAEASFESRGLAGALADLHKGAESGVVWRAVMDITSAYLLLSALSGTLLMLSIPKRRQTGIFTILAGAIAVAVVYVLWVPR